MVARKIKGESGDVEAAMSTLLLLLRRAMRGGEEAEATGSVRFRRLPTPAAASRCCPVRRRLERLHGLEARLLLLLAAPRCPLIGFVKSASPPTNP
ncbi:hypothetical protein HPB50_003141 [Hyalomma asiaticum]|uniref:Uncharacterized protein n=1 Tax=Hyalomma asiaticum TaxID=266040 RepID=A0ACB7SJA8_HYAAI|nr:hypothetical protein HPB50_003141 [Hyalomma asiaticum]